MYKISLWIDCLFEIRKIAVSFLWLSLPGDYRVTDEWDFISQNYVVWPTYFLMTVFIALKGSHFWFLFKGIFWKLATNEWSDKTLLISKLCPLNFGLNGLFAPARGLCLNFFSSITIDFNLSSALRWAIQTLITILLFTQYDYDGMKRLFLFNWN